MDYRVIKPHAPETDDRLVVRKGEKLSFERRPTNWDGWLFCTTIDGRTGWVPESYVTVDGGECTMSRDYDAYELTVAVGDAVIAEYEESGWVYGRTANNRRGWVPRENLEPDL